MVDRVVSPIDRIRWASVLGGVVTVLATIAVFTVLGLALGLSTFEVEQRQNFGIGAGIYGIIAALIAFALGGYMAARTTAVAGRGNAMLNGGMVWLVTIPLIVNMLGAGIGSLLGTATDLATTAASTAAQVAAPVAGQIAEEAANDPNIQPTTDAVATQAGGVVEDIQEQVGSISAQDVEAVARDVSTAAWTALLALGLTALASVLGGLAGTRTIPTDVVAREREPEITRRREGALGR
jgi:hypothetical protein